MFPVSITLHNPAQLNAVMAALALQASAEPTVAELTQQALQRAKDNDAPAPEVAAASAPKPGKPSPAAAATTGTPAPSSPTAEGAAATAAPAKTDAAPAPTAASAAAAAPASTAATDPVGYDQVARAITERVKTDRPGVVALLGRFGAKKGTELKPEQYADFLKALQEEATA